MLVTVLRESLLKQLDNGVFEPKKVIRVNVMDCVWKPSGDMKRISENARKEVCFRVPLEN